MRRRRVPLSEVIAGAVLGEAIVDAAGRVLLPSGVCLGDSTLAGLRHLGVDTVALEADDDPGQHAPPRAQFEPELRARFSRAGGGEATRLLFQATLEHFLEKPN